MSYVVDTVRTWTNERHQLYLYLDELANGLEEIHIFAEKFVVVGTTSRVVGTLLEASGLSETGEIIGLLLKTIGGGVITGADLYKLQSDLKALHSAEKSILEHRETHEHLQELAENCHCQLPSMDYRTLYETNSNPLSVDSEMLETLKALRDALRGRNGKQDYKEVNSKMTNMKQVGNMLRALDQVIQRDIPMLFNSLETLQGRLVPETVKRLRRLKNDLEMNEDEVAMQLKKMTCRQELD